MTAKQVRDAYPEEIRKLYGDLQISTPFGAISPDQKLIFFKLSAQSPSYTPLPEGRLKWPRSYQSDREGLVCFDVEHGTLLFFRRNWGHPAWDMKSTTILNTPNILQDARSEWQKFSADSRQLYLARAALNDLHAQRRLQLLDQAAERRLCDVQARRGVGEAA